MSSRNAMASALVAGVQKIASAQRTAHSRPRGEEPACRMAGRPCGLRGIDIGPRTETNGPSWSARRIFAGSANTPDALSITSASASQQSHSAKHAASTSSARS